MTGETANTIITAVRRARETGDGEAVAAALQAVEPESLAEFFHLSLDVGDDTEPVGQGLPASPGAAGGRIALSAADALEAADNGESVILVRPETSPDDVLGMQSAKGILTSRGGPASHAAVAARGWGIPAVVGATSLSIDGDTVTIGDATFSVGDEITIDGATGNIYPGRLAVSGSEPPPELAVLLSWADTVAAGRVQVRANADTGEDAARARSLGAQGIGLCRTEHMFLSPQRLPLVRRFILADSPEVEAEALDVLEQIQTADFESVLEAMDGLPVTIRLLDPPSHEFLPDLVELSVKEATGELSEAERIELGAVRRLHETNPMIGTRGVRLGVIRTGLYEMQVRALGRAAVNLFERGRRPRIEIMIPLVIDAEELRIARVWVTSALDTIGHPELTSEAVTIGAMIETPRAALTAEALARHADFLSFGTNDLTQMTYAFSRDDVEARLVPAYRALGILPENPFAVLDQDGVGRLVRAGCEGSRQAKPGIKLGACGEHAGHPGSADFLVRLGLDSVSCSPSRVPMARLGVARSLLDCGRVAIDDVVFHFTFDSEQPAPVAVAGTGSEPSRDNDQPDPIEGQSEVKAVAADEGEVEEQVEVDEALVLHVLRVRGFASAAGLIESLGAHPAAVLSGLVDAGHVRHLQARDLYSLMPSGKEWQAALQAEYANAELRTSLAEHYEPFLDLNTEFKELCSRWQVRDGEPNDHSDEAYDRTCVDALIDFNQRSESVLDGLALSLTRMARYRTRLAAAADQVAQGETRRFTGVMCESYHDIWMELHEDLIVLQGIDRADEGSF